MTQCRQPSECRQPSDLNSLDRVEADTAAKWTFQLRAALDANCNINFDTVDRPHERGLHGALERQGCSANCHKIHTNTMIFGDRDCVLARVCVMFPLLYHSGRNVVKCCKFCIPAKCGNVVKDRSNVVNVVNLPLWGDEW